MFWTDERKLKLIHLRLVKGLSFKEIRRFPAFRECSKNALIGAFNRAMNDQALKAKPFVFVEPAPIVYAALEKREEVRRKRKALENAPRLSSLTSSSSICAKEGCFAGKQPATPYCASHSREHIEKTQQPFYRNHGKVEL